MGLTPPAGVVGQACRKPLSPRVVRGSMVQFFRRVPVLRLRERTKVDFLSHGAVKKITIPKCPILLPEPYTSMLHTIRPLSSINSHFYFESKSWHEPPTRGGA